MKEHTCLSHRKKIPSKICFFLQKINIYRFLSPYKIVKIQKIIMKNIMQNKSCPKCPLSEKTSLIT